MSIIKIKTSKSNRANITLTTVVGNIKFDKECQAEIDENLLEQLKEVDPSISIVETVVASEESGKIKELPKKEEKKPVTTVKIPPASTTVKTNAASTDKMMTSGPGPAPVVETKLEPTPEELAQRKEVLEAMEKMEIGDLQAIANEKKLPEAEWKGFTKEGLITYLIDK